LSRENAPYLYTTEGSRYFYTTPDRGIAASLQDLTRLFTGKPACEAWSKGIAGVQSPSFVLQPLVCPG
jgi:hypothetical protein